MAFFQTLFSNHIRSAFVVALLTGLTACVTAPAEVTETAAETPAAATVADGTSKAPAPTWDQKKAELKALLSDTNLTLGDTPEGLLKLSIASDGLFGLGKTNISPAFAKVLDGIADALNRFPETGVEVVGHTDSTGSDALNLAISAKRAQNTREYLISRQVAADRITSHGWGSDQPVADNKTFQGRAANRRVEIFVSGR